MLHTLIPCEEKLAGAFVKKNKSTRKFFLFRQFTVMKSVKIDKGTDMRKRQAYCAIIQQRLSAYLDNELSPSLLDGVEKHLAECSRCQKEYAEQKKIWSSLAALSAPEPDALLEAAVLRQLSPKMSTKDTRPLFRWLFPVPAGAAAFGFALGIFLAVSATPPPNTLIAPDDGIMQALDVFSPSPQGSFSNAYFAMLNDSGR